MYLEIVSVLLASRQEYDPFGISPGCLNTYMVLIYPARVGDRKEKLHNRGLLHSQYKTI